MKMSPERLAAYSRELDVDAMGIAAISPEDGECPANCRSVIVLAAAYLDERTSDLSTAGEPHGIVARGEWKDHRLALAGKAERLALLLRSEGVQAVVADGLPLAGLAAKAGLGTIGKNSLLQSYDHGSWVMLAGVLTDIESPSSEAEGCRCGSCQACLRLCPTHAISRPFSVDGRLCLLGILGSGDMISHELREAIGKRVISCDACLEVCPRNKFVQPAPVRSEDRFGTWTRSPDLRSLAMLGEDEYQRHFASLDWGKDGRFLLRRNAIIALGNCGETGARQLLVDILQDPDPRLRGYAAWALGQLHDTSARERLEAGLLEERDAFAGEEMRSALVRLSEE